MKAVQDNAAKTNPDKIIIAIVLEVVPGMTINLAVGTLLRIIHKGLIVIISRRHIRDVVDLAGHLVVTVWITIQVGLVSIVANQVILRMSVRYCHPLTVQTRMVIGAHLGPALKWFVDGGREQPNI